jgi:hypothetical protein
MIESQRRQALQRKDVHTSGIRSSRKLAIALGEKGGGDDMPSGIAGGI